MENSNEYKALFNDLNLTALANRVGNTPLGDFGDNISGGERQRINTARTMIKQPYILIYSWFKMIHKGSTMISIDIFKKI